MNQDLNHKQVMVVSCSNYDFLEPVINSIFADLNLPKKALCGSFNAIEQSIISAPPEVECVFVILHLESFLDLGSSALNFRKLANLYRERLLGLVELVEDRNLQLLLCVPPDNRGISIGLSWSEMYQLRQLACDTRAAIYEIGSQFGSVSVVDLAYLAESIGYDNWYDERLWRYGRYPGGFKCKEQIRKFLTPVFKKLYLPTKKLIAVDLDNTLWGGILGEDGSSGLVVGRDYPGSNYLALQELLLSLKRTGILLAVLSKNNISEVEAAFNENVEFVLSFEDFVAVYADWAPKSDNLALISSDLSLNPNSFIFVDDSEIELAMMAKNFPEVDSVKIDARHTVDDQLLMIKDLFYSNSITDEDRIRHDFYKSDKKRRDLINNTETVEDFVSTLELNIGVHRFSTAASGRVLQLFERTNQFKFNISAPTGPELVESPSDFHLVSVRDKFGDYGLVGVVWTEILTDSLLIKNMVLSCRSLGRRVEYFVIDSLINMFGLREVKVMFEGTGRNAPALHFLDEIVDGDLSSVQEKHLSVLRIDSAKLKRTIENVKVRVSCESAIG